MFSTVNCRSVLRLARNTQIAIPDYGSLRVLTPPSHPGQAPNENFVDVSMGAAFIESHSNTQIGARIQNWPSSTRAELMGIFLALLVSPPNSIVHIHMDSQSAIHSINNVLQHKNAWRCRWLNHNNNLLLFKIYLLITEKRLQYFMHKVKGHSGDVGNDKADDLAKLSLDLDNFYDNRFTHGNCFVDKRFDYDWQTTWSTIKQVKFFKCTSTKHNSLWSFIIKALHNQLPIATCLKQRKPTLYSDLKCQFCHTNEETTNHLSTCTQMADFRTYLRSELIYFLNNTDEFQKLSPHIRSRTINSLFGFSPNSFECTSLLSDAMQAKISTTAISHLKKNLKLSRADSVRLGSKILMQIIILFKNHLWKDRCERVIKWEQSRNITVQDKHTHNHNHNHNSKACRFDRPITAEDEIIVLDGPDPITQMKHSLVYISPQQRFHDSLVLMHSQLQLYIKKYILLPWIYKPLSSFYYFDIGM
ncbi:unnamed protein product [Rhizophagus irregularis]|nr:unnamed protein product [Rhizophagus irregularis]